MSTIIYVLPLLPSDLLWLKIFWHSAFLRTSISPFLFFALQSFSSPLKPFSNQLLTQFPELLRLKPIPRVVFSFIVPDLTVDEIRFAEPLNLLVRLDTVLHVSSSVSRGLWLSASLWTSSSIEATPKRTSHFHKVGRRKSHLLITERPSKQNWTFSKQAPVGKGLMFSKSV